MLPLLVAWTFRRLGAMWPVAVAHADQDGSISSSLQTAVEASLTHSHMQHACMGPSTIHIQSLAHAARVHTINDIHSMHLLSRLDHCMTYILHGVQAPGLVSATIRTAFQTL